MSELERSGSKTVSTDDLLARARALTNREAPVGKLESVASVPDDPTEEPSFDWLQHRRVLLTMSTLNDAIESFRYQFGPWFAGNLEVQGLDEQDLDTYASWSITDVAWFFVDQVAHLGPAEAFLTVIRQPVPDSIGSWMQRSAPDLQKLVALAVENEDEVAFEELSARAITMLLGFARAWPTDIDELVPDLVDNLLAKLYEWADEPWSMTVWEDYEDRWSKEPLKPPKKARIISKAACYLEHAYAGMFFRMADG